MTKKTLLIDGDVFIYKVAASQEVATEWDDDLWTLHANADAGRAALKDTLQGLKDKLAGDELIIALTDKHNFRKDILPSYKANRAGVRRPMLLAPLRDFVRKEYTVFERPGLEADDVLGILSTSTRIVPGEKWIVSVDKDFKSVPGNFYDSNKDHFYQISTPQADYHHLMQTLTGDTTDGYKGCPGIGAVKAAKILDVFFDADPKKHQVGNLPLAWAAVVAHFEKAGFSEEEALVQARVARICRYQDYDFTNKKPIPWKPPK